MGRRVKNPFQAVNVVRAVSSAKRDSAGLGIACHCLVDRGGECELSTTRLRVVQWATGNIGLRALREVIRHLALELAGVLVYDPEKDGVDAGTLCGEDPVGVLASTERAAVRALGADCVLYMPRSLDLEEVVALLESRANIVTTRGELFGAGHRLGHDGRAQVLAACKRGGS